MRLRDGVFLFCFLCLAALAAGCTMQAEEREELRIGLLAPVGLPVRFTVQRMLDERVRELNAAGGLDLDGRKVPVRLFIEDSGNRTEQTLSAMGRLVRQDNISALIGPYYSGEAIPVGAAMENFQVPMITPSASNPAVTRARGYVFRMSQLDSDQGRMLAMHAYEVMGIRRAAVLYDESDAYAAGMADMFRKAFGGMPGASIHMETYEAGALSVLPQMERIRAFGAKALLLPNVNRDLSGQLQQARAAGFAGVFLGGDSWDTDQGFHTMPEAQGALYSTDFSPAAADAKQLAAALALAEKTGAFLDKDAALTLDAFELLLAAARRAGSTEPGALRDALRGLKGFEGLSGPVSFGAGGDPERSGFLMGINGGEARLVARMGTQRRREGQ